MVVRGRFFLKNRFVGTDFSKRDCAAFVQPWVGGEQPSNFTLTQEAFWGHLYGPGAFQFEEMSGPVSIKGIGAGSDVLSPFTLLRAYDSYPKGVGIGQAQREIENKCPLVNCHISCKGHSV